MSYKPLVSVIIPAYNHHSYVESAVKSVIDQTYGFENIQLIITDDHSKDQTPELLKELNKKYRFKLILHKQNIGISSTLNEMIALAEGKYIITFASDDVMTLDRIEKQVNILENDQAIDVLAGGSILIDENGDVIGTNASDSDHTLTQYYFEDIFLLKWSGLTAGTAIIKRELFEKIGAYDTTLKVEDYYFWLKAAFNNAKIVNCKIPFMYYRIHGNSISVNEKLINDEVAKILDLYKTHPSHQLAVRNHKIYNLFKSVFVSKHDVVRLLAHSPDLLLSFKTLKIVIMLFLPKFILKKRFPENYHRNAKS